MSATLRHKKTREANRESVESQYSPSQGLYNMRPRKACMQQTTTANKTLMNYKNHQDTADNQEGISAEKMELINTTLDKLYNDPSSPAAFAGVTTLWKEARKKLKNLRKRDCTAHYLEGQPHLHSDAPSQGALSKGQNCCGWVHDRCSNKGTEFKNRLLKEFFEEQEIEKHEPVHSSVKASVAERAIRNVKQRLYRYFAEMETLNWVDAVQKIVDGINNAPSRIHGMRPIDVMTFQMLRKCGSEYEFVRMSREKGQFEKGYLPNYGDEILEIDEVLKALRPIRYKLRDEHGEKFKGSFYEQELARVRKDAETSYRIEKVYRKRKLSDGSTEMLVKFIGYPNREWINESQLQCDGLSGQSAQQISCFDFQSLCILMVHGVCGLHSISYPYSWSTIGTLDAQWIDIHFFDRHAFDEDRQRVIRVPVAQGIA
ncbi:hypothetical protein niasHT_006443 [Heterodera trifolii]|uniref:Transposase n=1 Tax=Heterodera trifolii TaxID=157864 RepID=A0ABD2LRM4_9BILA